MFDNKSEETIHESKYPRCMPTRMITNYFVPSKKEDNKSIIKDGVLPRLGNFLGSCRFEISIMQHSVGRSLFNPLREEDKAHGRRFKMLVHN